MTGLKAEHPSIAEDSETITRSEELAEDDPIVVLMGLFGAGPVTLSETVPTLTTVQKAAP